VGEGRAPNKIDLDLDLPNAGSPPAPPAAPQGDTFGLDDLEQGGAMPIELDDPSLARPKPMAARTAAAASARDDAPPSGGRIHVSRHSQEKRPTGLAFLAATVLVVACLVAIMPFLHPVGVARLESALGDNGFAPVLVFGLLLLVLWAMTLSRAIQHGSLGLHLAAIAAIVKMILVALITSAMVSDSSSAKAFLKIMPYAAPVACGVFVLGVSLRGLRLAVDELRGDDRRIALGLFLTLLSLAGVALAVRVGRFDLPLPRLGEPLKLELWR
jgi:hypothetical protein